MRPAFGLYCIGGVDGMHAAGDVVGASARHGIATARAVALPIIPA